MTDPFSDRYWIEEFQTTEADLNRIADHIRETGKAHDLTVLAGHSMTFQALTP